MGCVHGVSLLEVGDLTGEYPVIFEVVIGVKVQVLERVNRNVQELIRRVIDERQEIAGRQISNWGGRR